MAPTYAVPVLLLFKKSFVTQFVLIWKKVDPLTLQTTAINLGFVIITPSAVKDTPYCMHFSEALNNFLN